MSDSSATRRSRTAKAAPRPPADSGRGHAAARKVHAKEHVTVSLPVVGAVGLPHPQQLAYLAGIGVLAALEIIEWPAALALAVGHALVTQQHSRALEELGDALDEA